MAVILNSSYRKKMYILTSTKCYDKMVFRCCCSALYSLINYTNYYSSQQNTIFLYDFRLPLFQGAAVEYLAPLLALGTVDTTFCVATDSEYQIHNNIIYATRVSYFIWAMVVRLCGKIYNIMYFVLQHLVPCEIFDIFCGCSLALSSTGPGGSIVFVFVMSRSTRRHNQLVFVALFSIHSHSGILILLAPHSEFNLLLVLVYTCVWSRILFLEQGARNFM